MKNILFIMERWHILYTITHNYIVHFTYFFNNQITFKQVFIWFVSSIIITLCEFDQYVELKTFLQKYHN